MRSSTARRVVDLVAATLILVLAAPVMLVVAVLIFCCMGRPVLFRQVRAGHRGKPFTLIKFRTMREARSPSGRPLPDAQRLTRLGRILRSTSLDELPQILNVLWGDMSLLGPRPLLVEYLDRYNPEQARRHDVKPGLTGWAQAHGRNSLSWEEKFELDVWYVDNRSLWVDAWIVLCTVWQVLRRKGVSHAGAATMPEFTGSDRKASASFGKPLGLARRPFSRGRTRTEYRVR